MNNTLKTNLINYIPYDEQEEKDKEYILQFMDNFDNYLDRENIFGHISASAFVVNKDRSKMLVVYHIINDGWMYPGGHADGQDDLFSVAVREVEEETGQKTKVIDENIFAIQIGPVKGHFKKGKYVSAHVHMDIMYILEADDSEILYFRDDESKGVKWIDFSDATNSDIVDFIIPVHKKIIEKQKKLNIKKD